MRMFPDGDRLRSALYRVLFFLLLMLVSADAAHAHQPRIAFGARHSFFNPIVIEKPEISKAYYGELAGNADYYRIDSGSPYQLYLNILVPDRRDSRLDMHVDVVSDNKTLLKLTGKGFHWTRFFEPFGRDSYLKGPELDWRLRQGTYYIKVSNKGNQGKYALAVGSIESFPLTETVRMAFTLPVIKAQFFNKPGYSAFLTPAGLILFIYTLIALGIVSGIVIIIRKHFIHGSGKKI
jgi:hypothetical protein